MRISITRGWQSMKEQSYILILLFIYRLLWGYFMYGFIRSAIIPILQRYPDHDAGGSQISRILYLIEGQSSLYTDPAIRGWLWMLLGLITFRLLLSPFIRAGLLHELHQEREGKRGLFFFPGMKRHGIPVLLFSIIEWALVLLPIYWLARPLYELFLSSFLNYSLWLQLTPYLIAWLIYIYFVRLLLLYMQFGYTSGTGMFASLFICIRSLFPAIGVSILLGAGGLIILILCGLSGFFWPGLPALLIRQIAPLPSTLLKMWSISGQYHLWRSKAFPQ